MHPLEVTSTDLLNHLHLVAPYTVWPLERFLNDFGGTPYTLGQLSPDVVLASRGIGPKTMRTYATALHTLGVPMRPEWRDYAGQ